MDVTEEMLERYKLTFNENNPLSALQATELTRNGLEQGDTKSVGLDPPAESGLPTGLTMIHQDDNDPRTPWAFNPANQRTFVLVQGGSGPEMGIVYRFDGLLTAVDAKEWFRNRLGF